MESLQRLLATRKVQYAFAGLFVASVAIAHALATGPARALACGSGEGETPCANYGKLTENVGSEVGAAVPIALAAVGIFVGILVAYKLARRMIRA